MLSQRIELIKPSPTIQVTGRAIELKRQGLPIITLSAGEPDFPTPAHIKQAAIDAIENNFTRYTQVEGILPLREAVCAKMKRDHDLDYMPAEISVASGAKQSIFNLMGVVLNAGDEVIIPAPYWVSYPDMAVLFDATPVIVMGDASLRLKITPEALAAAITPKSKLLILNSPSNPTGVAYTREELKALGDVLEKHPHIIICSDDIYEKTLWRGEFVNILMTNPALKERTVLINGVSKAYAMTGWRLGYAAGPLNLIKAMNKLQSQSTSNASSISQYAALAALTGDQNCIAPMVKAFKARHDYLLHEFAELPGFEMLEADGAFYAFIDVRSAIQNLGYANDLQFANFLLDTVHVAGVPGSAFGMEGYLRFSFATSEAELTEVVARLKNTFSS